MVCRPWQSAAGLWYLHESMMDEEWRKTGQMAWYHNGTV